MHCEVSKIETFLYDFYVQKQQNGRLQQTLETERKSYEEKMKRELGALKEQLQVRCFPLIMITCMFMLMSMIHASDSLMF